MVLAVLSRITGNLNLIFVLCGKFIYLETVGIPLLRYFHPKGLRVLYEVGHSFWNLFPTHHFLSSERARSKKTKKQGFPGGAVVENLPANAGDTGSSPGLGRSHMPRSN